MINVICARISVEKSRDHCLEKKDKDGLQVKHVIFVFNKRTIPVVTHNLSDQEITLKFSEIFIQQHYNNIYSQENVDM